MATSGAETSITIDEVATLSDEWKTSQDAVTRHVGETKTFIKKIFESKRLVAPLVPRSGPSRCIKALC